MNQRGKREVDKKWQQCRYSNVYTQSYFVCSHDYDAFVRLTLYHESDAEQFHGRSIVLISHAYNLGFQNDTNRKCKLKISVTLRCSMSYWCVCLIQSTQLSALCNTKETSINHKNLGGNFYFWFSGSKELYISKT